MKKIILQILTLAIAATCAANSVELYSSFKNEGSYTWTVDSLKISKLPKYNPLADASPPLSISEASKVALKYRKEKSGGGEFVVWSISMEPIDEGLSNPMETKQPVHWCYQISVMNKDFRKAIQEQGNELVIVLLDGSIVEGKLTKE